MTRSISYVVITLKIILYYTDFLNILVFSFPCDVFIQLWKISNQGNTIFELNTATVLQQR